MSRLFITHREIAFISDLHKELVHDISGQYIIYYPISILHTRVHEIYDEAVEKVFENPIKVGVLAGQPERENKYNNFGIDRTVSMEIFIQPRDLIDRGLKVTPGDFYVYGSEVYEVTDAIEVENIFGQVEHDRGIKMTGRLARIGQFDIEDFKNLLEESKKYENSNEQKTFIQQRGLAENEEGLTNDTRQIRERLGDGMADIALGEGPRKVAPDTENQQGEPLDEASEPKGDSFYNQ